MAAVATCANAPVVLKSSPAAKIHKELFGRALCAFPAPAGLSQKRLTVKVRASESSEVSGTQKQVQEALETAKTKWDQVEDKPTVLLYAGGSVLALWITSAVIGAIDSIPLIPDFLKLVGTLYSGWFVYRYLLFESSRKELAVLIEGLKDQIAGTK